MHIGDMSSLPSSCQHHQRSRQLRTERPLGIAGPRRAPKRPDEPGWRRVARRREHSEPVMTSRLQGNTTLVRRCRDFYAQRLRQSELLRNKWAAGAAVVPQSPPGSASQAAAAAPSADDDATASSDGEATSTWRRSRFDLAMDSLRKEIVSWQLKRNFRVFSASRVVFPGPFSGCVVFHVNQWIAVLKRSETTQDRVCCLVLAVSCCAREISGARKVSMTRTI